MRAVLAAIPLALALALILLPPGAGLIATIFLSLAALGAAMSPNKTKGVKDEPV